MREPRKFPEWSSAEVSPDNLVMGGAVADV